MSKTNAVKRVSTGPYEFLRSGLGQTFFFFEKLTEQFIPSRIKYGVHNRTGRLDGQTIGMVKRELVHQWMFPFNADAFKGTERLTDDYVIRPGDYVEFHRQMDEEK